MLDLNFDHNFICFKFQNFRVKGRFNLEVLCGGNITFEEISEYIDHLKDKINLEENILARNKIRLERVYQVRILYFD